MKHNTSLFRSLIAGLTLTGSASAATVFTAVGTYPGLSGSGPIETEATTDTGNELSHATFVSNVTNAFAGNTGGVMDFESENEDNSAPGSINGISFGGGAYKLSFNNTFNTVPSNGRTPTSGDEGTTYGSTTPTITFNTIYDSSDVAIVGAGVIQVGYVMLSRNSAAANVSMTANFSGGGSATQNSAMAGTGGADDTFFGFVAPVGQTITSLSIDMGGQFLGSDDFGFVTNVPEPSTALLGAFGLTFLLRRRR